MNGVDLFLLGRTLMKIGEEALPTEGIGEQSTSVRTVLIVVSDVRAHPGSAVGQIATRTGISENTVKYHLRNILYKLHLKNRAQVVAYAVRHGLVDPGRNA